MAPIIELTEITKLFGAFRALDRVSLSVQPGVTGLLGPNGAGKTTLIKILLGLLPATSGSGRLLGLPLAAKSRAIRARVGYMPEDDCYLYGLSGIEMVHVSAQLAGFPRVESLRRAHEILDYCGLGQERYRFVETYSTGMRQKLRFAQAIVHDPPVLILDEPTSGLDPDERDAMLRRIRRLADDQLKTVILCTHILPDIQSVSDAAVILANGQVRIADTLRNLSAPAQPAVLVRVMGPTQAFLEALVAAGLDAEQDPTGTVTVLGDDAALVPRVWRTAQQTGTIIRGLLPAHNSLEAIFLAAVKGQTSGTS